MIFGFIISFLCLFFGVWSLIKMISLRIKCKYQVEAVVEGFDIIRYKRRSSYLPIYSYSFDGKSYSKKSRLSDPKRSLQEGSYVKLYIDPDDPDKFYCPEETFAELAVWLIWISMSCFVIIAFGVNLEIF